MAIFISHVHTDINMLLGVRGWKRILYEDKFLWLMGIKKQNCDFESEFWKFVFRPVCYWDEVGGRMEEMFNQHAN